MKRFAAPLLVLVVALFALCPAEAQDKKKKKVKIDPAKLKKILKKIDPEIRAAQTALNTAKKNLNAALNDEVFGEKGAVEGAVIDQLKIALKNTDAAIAATRKAQTLDKGGD